MNKSHIQLELERNPLEVLLRYVEGKLSSPESKTVETLVAENPVYTDALEGLQSMENPALARSMTNDLRFRTRSLLRRTAKPRIAQFNLNQYITSAVAVVVILFAAASVVYFYSRNDVETAGTIASAEQEDSQTAAIDEKDDRLRPFKRTAPVEHDGPSLTEELMADAEQPGESASKRSLLDEYNEAPAETAPARPATTTSSKPAPATAGAREDTITVALRNEPTLSDDRKAEYEEARTREEAAEEKIAEAEESIADDFAEEAKEEVAASKARSSSPERTAGVVTQGNTFEDPAKAWRERQAKKTALTKKGEVFFNTSKYAEAEKVFLELYTMDQLDPKTQYYLGSTYFYLGRPAEATIYLEQVIRVSSDYLEEAQWRLADAYLAVNKLDEAKTLLKKISKQNGKYSDRAQAKYKDLK
jgi:tetratricopeptide (TPR) repeat protein